MDSLYIYWSVLGVFWFFFFREKLNIPLSCWVAAPTKSLIPEKNYIIQKGLGKGVKSKGVDPHTFDAMPTESKASFVLLPVV